MSAVYTPKPRITDSMPPLRRAGEILNFFAPYSPNHYNCSEKTGDPYIVRKQSKIWFYISTDLVPVDPAHMFIDPTYGYHIPEILSEIHPSLTTCPAYVGISCCDEVEEITTGRWAGVAKIHLCHPTKAKYLLLSVAGTQAHALYNSDFYHITNIYRSEHHRFESRLDRDAEFHRSERFAETRLVNLTGSLWGWPYQKQLECPRYYVDYRILPMGYSYKEPKDPDMLQCTRKRHTEHYQQLMLDHLCSYAWCNKQYDLMMQYHANEWRRPAQATITPDETA